MLLGLGCQKQVGKDSFYKIVKENFPNLSIKRLAFADALKTEIFQYAFMPHGLSYQEIENKELSRPLLQAWGVFKRDAVDKDYWVNQVKEQFHKLKNNYDFIFISDLRFRNELDWLYKEGGLYLKIIRPSLSDSDSHASEQDLVDVIPDHLILNEGTYEEYTKMVCDFMTNLLKK